MFPLEAFPSELVAQRFRPAYGLVTLTDLKDYGDLANAVATLCGYDLNALKEGAGETGRTEHDWTAYADATKQCFVIRWRAGEGTVLLAFGTDQDACSRKPRFWLAGLADDLAWPALSTLNHHLHGWLGPDDLRKAFAAYGDGTISRRGVANEQHASLWVATDEAGELPTAVATEAWQWLGAISIQPFPAARPLPEIRAKVGVDLQPGDRLLGGRSFDPGEELLLMRKAESLPPGITELLARTSVRRALEMFDSLLTPRLEPTPPTEEVLDLLEQAGDATLRALAHERLLQLQMTVIRPPVVRGSEAVFSQSFRAKPGQALIGTQDPCAHELFPSGNSRDLIIAVVRETLEFTQQEVAAKPQGFLDGFGWSATGARLNFMIRPVRRPYYLPLRGLPCRVARQAIVWREGEDLALAVDFGVRAGTVLFGRLTVRRGRGRA